MIYKRIVRAGAFGGLGCSFACGHTADQHSRPTTIFSPVAAPADSIWRVSLFVLAVAAAIFVVVFSLLVNAVVRFRKEKKDDEQEPPQVYGSNQVELAWTVIPVLIVVALFMTTVLDGGWQQ